jgi:hypothetical protein
MSQENPSLLIDDYILNVVEYVAVDKTKPEDEETKATDRDANSTDSDEFKWIEVHKENTYFTLINNNRSDLDSVSNHIGNYSNDYLLLNYGVCLIDNPFDRF